RRAQIFERPDARRMRRGTIERAPGHVAPEQFAVAALHDPVVAVSAFLADMRGDALADAREFVRRWIQHLERLADERVAHIAEDRADLLVAVLDDALARKHEPDGREMKRGLI